MIKRRQVHSQNTALIDCVTLTPRRIVRERIAQDHVQHTQRIKSFRSWTRRAYHC